MKMRISIKWMSSCMGVLLYAWKPIQFAGFSTAACVLVNVAEGGYFARGMAEYFAQSKCLSWEKDKIKT